MKRLILKQGRERAVALRHPWVFSGAIAREEGDGESPVATLHTHDGALVGSGFYSASSQIRLRVLSFGTEIADAAMIAALIRDSIHRRDALRSKDIDCVRLVNSEGDGISGLVVDLYRDAVVVEISSAGLEAFRETVVETIDQEVRPRTIAFRNDLPARKIEGLPLVDEMDGDPGAVRIRENGLVFELTPASGQKTGFFLDQRDNRALARTLASGRRVLNLFAYSGGFGVNAAAGGAATCEEVDISAPAIEQAKVNHSLNPSATAVSYAVADAFDWTRKAGKEGKQYDLVVCDPPAFAKSRGEVDRAARGYKDINLQAFRLAAPGALVMTFSCSGHVDADLFQKIVFSAALDARREVSILRRLGAGMDHPVSLFAPEGEYLKGFLLRVDR